MTWRRYRGRTEGDSDPCTGYSRFREREDDTKDPKSDNEGDGAVDGDVSGCVLVDLAAPSPEGDVERQGDQGVEW